MKILKCKKLHYFLVLLLLLNPLFFLHAREELPPLAPPSKLALSLDEMILHFKIFVIADIFQRTVSLKGESAIDLFEFTDLELDILINDAIEKAPLLNQTQPLKVFFYNQNLYIQLENSFFICYLLEVVPGQFDLKTEPISDSEFNDILKNKVTAG